MKYENLPCTVCSFDVAYKTSTSFPFLQTTFTVSHRTQNLSVSLNDTIWNVLVKADPPSSDVQHWHLFPTVCTIVMHSPRIQIHLPQGEWQCDSIKISLRSYMHFKAASTRVLKANRELFRYSNRTSFRVKMLPRFVNSLVPHHPSPPLSAPVFVCYSLEELLEKKWNIF